jgi:hypothetical protein
MDIAIHLHLIKNLSLSDTALLRWSVFPFLNCFLYLATDLFLSFIHNVVVLGSTMVKKDMLKSLALSHHERV